MAFVLCPKPREVAHNTNEFFLTLSLLLSLLSLFCCIFDMKDVTGCKPAVKIDGKAYLVSGKSMDDLGDANADDGLCNIARKAEVTGKLDGDRFVVTKMAFLPK